MLEFLTQSPNDITALIKNDHQKVKDLFDAFENTDNRREKVRIVGQALMELKLHAEAEEKIFYNTIRRELKKDIMNEADEEHHVAKVLIAELDSMDGSEDHYDAKFKVLSENIRHHIREEEGRIIPRAHELNLDFEAMGNDFTARKDKLKTDGIPPSLEEKMIKRVHNHNDSSAETARMGMPSRKVPKKASKTAAKKSAPKAPAKAFKGKVIKLPTKGRKAPSKAMMSKAISKNAGKSKQPAKKASSRRR